MTTMHGVPFKQNPNVRVGFVGVGGRGQGLINEMLYSDGVELVAIADERADMIDMTHALLEKRGRQRPATFQGVESWKRMFELDLDLVCIATSWESHAPIAVAAMEAGVHAAVEVPAAVTIEQCWQMVETSEHTRRHCMILENCCYGYWEMLAKRMAFAGLFGTITHAECAYIHDLRHQLFFQDNVQQWRRQAHVHLNGNHYPTHGLGPVAQCLKIGAGDAFDYMVSMSSREASLSEYRAENLAQDDLRRKEVYSNGDMNVSLLRTKKGATIVLQHAVVTPRPYDRIFLLAGSKGAFRDYPPRLHLDKIAQPEEWLNPEDFKAEWEDPLWTHQGELALKLGGHGGMDFLMMYRLIEAMHLGQPPDLDVYDAADWSAPGPLSFESVARRSIALDFPDFRGK
jgi:predicted dehydrogenase